MSTPFEADRGRHQQRIATNALAGGASYELGHSHHFDANFAVGDRHDMSQTFVVSAQASLVRARVRLEASAAPIGNWIFEALLNGVVQYSRPINVADRVVQLLTLAVRLAGANVSPATNVITFRLRLA